MDVRKGIVTLTSLELMQVLLKKRKKAKGTKMREEEVASKSRNIQATIYNASEVQRRRFCGACKRTENGGTCCYRLRSTLR